MRKKLNQYVYIPDSNIYLVKTVTCSCSLRTRQYSLRAEEFNPSAGGTAGSHSYKTLNLMILQITPLVMVEPMKLSYITIGWGKNET